MNVTGLVTLFARRTEAAEKIWKAMISVKLRPSCMHCRQERSSSYQDRFMSSVLASPSRTSHPGISIVKASPGTDELSKKKTEHTLSIAESGQ